MYFVAAIAIGTTIALLVFRVRKSGHVAELEDIRYIKAESPTEADRLADGINRGGSR